MKIAALSDLHLGFKGAGRSEGGRSVRERDVERAWAAAVRGITERDVDLVLIGGDCFDGVVPSTAAKAAFMEGVAQLASVTCPVVIVGGNHETPRTQGVMSPNVLGQYADAHVELLGAGDHFTHNTRAGETYDVQGFGYSCLGREKVVQPEPLGVDVNILLIHAAVRSSARPGWPNPYYGGPGAFDVARAEGFDIVACGDYHEFAVLCAPDGWRGSETLDHLNAGSGPEGAPLAFYPGSLERVSSNIWSEHAPKGWVLVDTAARTLEFVEVPTRRMVDVVAECCIDGPLMLNATLGSLLERSDTADALVRLKATDILASERDAIDHGLIRQLHQRCVHFRLDVEWVGDEAKGEEAVAQRGRSLDEMVAQYAEGEDPAVVERIRAHLGLGEPVLEEVGNR